MVADEIGHASVVMTEKYAKCNLRRLQDDFPSLSDRIALRLTPPMEDSYFTNLLKHLKGEKWQGIPLWRIPMIVVMSKCCNI